MKIFLDDSRRAPDETWTVCRTVEEAKALWLSNFDDLTDASLDYDLGLNYCRACSFRDAEEPCLAEPKCDCVCHTPVPSGLDFLMWVNEHRLWPKFKPQVHSTSKLGLEVMNRLIEARYGLNDK